MSLLNLKVLVTGATGFIGHSLAERLAKEEKAEVIGAGRDLQKAQLLKQYNIEIVNLNLLDAAQLEPALKDISYVFNCAGAISADRQKAYDINVKATEQLVKAASKAGVKRLVHISTVGVYNMKVKDAVDEDTPLAIDHPSNYPRTKAQGDKRVLELGKEYDLEVVVLRPSMVYGPGHGVWTSMMYQNVSSGKPVFLGDGSFTFNPVYLNDVVDALVKAATTPSAAGEAFNISATTTTWKNFMNYYGRSCNKEPKGMPAWIARALAFANKIPGLNTPIDEGFIEMATSKKFFPVDKAKRLLGWQPSTPLDDGMKRTLEWLEKRK